MKATGARAADSREAGIPLLPIELSVVAGFCGLKLLLHLFTSVRNYGYFRDELYFLDLARHLDWGYVDAAPLIGVYAKVALWLGGSLAALRIIPALAGTVLIGISIFIARELGGGRFAQLLTAILVLLAPGLLAEDNLLTMNAFEPVYWMACILVLARLLRTGDSSLWLWFGLLAGVALENKHSTLFFGLSVVVALLLTRNRREFIRPWIWIGGLLALALFLPNLLWQIQHHFPTLEDLENVRREGKNVVLGPIAFVRQQIIAMHPILFPVWLTGAIWLLRNSRWRVLGLTFVVFFCLMEISHAKDYYLFPIYPMLFAAGAVALEQLTAARSTWWRVTVIGITTVAGLITLPLATWMLSPQRYLEYGEALGFKPQKAEVGHAGLLPQAIGDQFGWPEMVAEVAQIYQALSPGERVKTGIFAGNYGEAGAINLFGPALNLPRAYSRHQTHWYWGPPDVDYSNLIVLQWSHDDVQRYCSSFAAYPHHERFGMSEENTPIYLCRGTKFNLREIWWRSHHWN
jgi:hypothetical protein